NGKMVSGGTYTAATNSVISCRINSTLTIENGYFYSNSYGTVIFTETNSTTHIKGGKFEAKESYNGMWFVLDIDESEEQATRGKYVITGGEFVNYNPANSAGDGDYKNKLDSANYHSIYNEETSSYTVSAHTPADAVEENRVESSCTVAGSYYSVVYCQDCGVELSRTKIALELAAHTLVHHDAQAPTCENIGWDAYDTCEECTYTTYVKIDALDHKPAETWTSDENGKHYKECLNGCGTKLDETACSGTMQYDADNHWKVCECGYTLVAQTAHSGGTATCTDKAVCATCNNAYGSIDENAHSWDAGVVTTPATCTSTGVKTYTCTHNGSHTRLEDVEIDANAHAPSETWTSVNGQHYHECENGCNEKLDLANCAGGTATCTEPATCQTCNQAYGNANGHSFTNYTSNNDATCTADGTETAKCDNCEEEDTRTEEGSANGHSTVHHDAVSATCTETGNSEYWSCENCDKLFADQDATIETTLEEVTIDANGHDTENVEWSVDEENGTHYKVCNECGEKADEAKHSSTAKPENTHKDYHTFTCDTCQTKYTETHNVFEEGCAKCDIPAPQEGWYLVTDASTLKAGDQIVIVASNFNFAMSTTQNNNNRGQAGIAKNENALGTLNDDVQIIELQAGNKEGTFAFYVDEPAKGYLYAASSSSNHLKTEASLSDNSSWTITIDAETGVAIITAQGSYSRNLLRYNQSSSVFSCYDKNNNQKDVSIYRNETKGFVCNHTNTTTTTNPATCLETGLTVVTCTYCGHSVETEIPATGHTEVVDAAVAPTCTETGLTEGKHCSVCGTKTVPQQEVAASGHTFTRPSNVEDNHTQHALACANCDAVSDQFADHVWVDHKCVCGHDEPTIAITVVNNAIDEVKATYELTPVGNYYKNDQVTLSVVAPQGYKVSVTANGEPIELIEGNYEFTVTSAIEFQITLEEETCNHVWGAPENVDSADSHKISCTLCDEYYNEGHDFVAKEIADDDSNHNLVCACGYTTTAEHNYGEVEQHNDTHHKQVCEDCEHIKTVEHSFGEWSSVDAEQHSHTCSVCEQVVKANHTIEEHDAQSATCEDIGWNAYEECADCNYTTYSEIPATGHSYGEWTTTTPATCTTAGEKTRTCANDANHKETEAIPATGHQVENNVCKVCHEIFAWVATDLANIKSTDVVVIVYSKDGTSWAISNDKGGSTAPTAVVVKTADGKITEDIAENIKWNITNENGTLTIYVNGTTETWLYCTNSNNGVRVGTNENKAFTIDAESGYLKNTATSRYVGVYITNPDVRCYDNTTGNTAGQTLAFYTLAGTGKIQCQHENTTETTVDATCTVAGSTTVTCDDCGDTISTTEIPAGHKYESVVTDPTCEDDGYTTHTCSVCGDNYTDNPTDATGHKDENDDKICDVCEAEVACVHVWGEVQAHDADDHKYQCAKCLVEFLYEAHTENAGVITSEATCVSNGVKTYSCTKCEAVMRTEIILATGEHTYVDGACTGCGAVEPTLTPKTYSYTFTAKQWSANGDTTLNNVKWTLAGDGGYWGYDGTKGQQLGSGGSPYKSMTLTSASFSNVTKIVINTSGASSVNASFVVTVGGTKVGDSTTITTTATSYKFNVTGLSGPIVFQYTQTSSKAIYIKSISVDYAE
ncbi:MAG: hypothetical protein IJX23_00475, partial [Clostridia bacterium]|nr:hypothetical protein [Clostridia bacterium]